MSKKIIHFSHRLIAAIVSVSLMLPSPAYANRFAGVAAKGAAGSAEILSELRSELRHFPVIFDTRFVPSTNRVPVMKHPEVQAHGLTGSPAHSNRAEVRSRILEQEVLFEPGTPHFQILVAALSHKMGHDESTVLALPPGTLAAPDFLDIFMQNAHFLKEFETQINYVPFDGASFVEAVHRYARQYPDLLITHLEAMMGKPEFQPIGNLFHQDYMAIARQIIAVLQQRSEMRLLQVKSVEAFDEKSKAAGLVHKINFDNGLALNMDSEIFVRLNTEPQSVSFRMIPFYIIYPDELMDRQRVEISLDDQLRISNWGTEDAPDDEMRQVLEWVEAWLRVRMEAQTAWTAEGFSGLIERTQSHTPTLKFFTATLNSGESIQLRKGLFIRAGESDGQMLLSLELPRGAFAEIDDASYNYAPIPAKPGMEVVVKDSASGKVEWRAKVESLHAALGWIRFNIYPEYPLDPRLDNPEYFSSLLKQIPVQFTVRAKNRLFGVGILTLRTYLEHSPAELLKYRMFGKKTSDAIETMLAQNQISRELLKSPRSEVRQPGSAGETDGSPLEEAAEVRAGKNLDFRVSILDSNQQSAIKNQKLEKRSEVRGTISRPLSLLALSHAPSLGIWPFDDHIGQRQFSVPASELIQHDVGWGLLVISRNAQNTILSQKLIVGMGRIGPPSLPDGVMNLRVYEWKGSDLTAASSELKELSINMHGPSLENRFHSSGVLVRAANNSGDAFNIRRAVIEYDYQTDRAFIAPEKHLQSIQILAVPPVVMESIRSRIPHGKGSFALNAYEIEGIPTRPTLPSGLESRIRAQIGKALNRHTEGTQGLTIAADQYDSTFKTLRVNHPTMQSLLEEMVPMGIKAGMITLDHTPNQLIEKIIEITAEREALRSEVRAPMGWSEKFSDGSRLLEEDMDGRWTAVKDLRELDRKYKGILNPSGRVTTGLWVSRRGSIQQIAFGDNWGLKFFPGSHGRKAELKIMKNKHAVPPDLLESVELEAGDGAVIKGHLEILLKNMAEKYPANRGTYLQAARKVHRAVLINKVSPDAAAHGSAARAEIRSSSQANQESDAEVVIQKIAKWLKNNGRYFSLTDEQIEIMKRFLNKEIGTKEAYKTILKCKESTIWERMLKQVMAIALLALERKDTLHPDKMNGFLEGMLLLFGHPSVEPLGWSGIKGALLASSSEQKAAEAERAHQRLGQILREVTRSIEEERLVERFVLPEDQVKPLPSDAKNGAELAKKIHDIWPKIMMLRNGSIQIPLEVLLGAGGFIQGSRDEFVVTELALRGNEALMAGEAVFTRKYPSENLEHATGEAILRFMWRFVGEPIITEHPQSRVPRLKLAEEPNGLRSEVRMLDNAFGEGAFIEGYLKLAERARIPRDKALHRYWVVETAMKLAGAVNLSDTAKKLLLRTAAVRDFGRRQEDSNEAQFNATKAKLKTLGSKLPLKADELQAAADQYNRTSGMPEVDRLEYARMIVAQEKAAGHLNDWSDADDRVLGEVAAHEFETIRILEEELNLDLTLDEVRVISAHHWFRFLEDYPPQSVSLEELQLITAILRLSLVLDTSVREYNRSLEKLQEFFVTHVAGVEGMPDSIRDQVLTAFHASLLEGNREWYENVLRPAYPANLPPDVLPANAAFLDALAARSEVRTGNILDFRLKNLDYDQKSRIKNQKLERSEVRGSDLEREIDDLQTEIAQREENQNIFGRPEEETAINALKRQRAELEARLTSQSGANSTSAKIVKGKGASEPLLLSNGKEIPEGRSVVLQLVKEGQRGEYTLISGPDVLHLLVEMDASEEPKFYTRISWNIQWEPQSIRGGRVNFGERTYGVRGYDPNEFTVTLEPVDSKPMRAEVRTEKSLDFRLKNLDYDQKSPIKNLQLGRSELRLIQMRAAEQLGVSPTDVLILAPGIVAGGQAAVIPEFSQVNAVAITPTPAHRAVVAKINAMYRSESRSILPARSVEEAVALAQAKVRELNLSGVSVRSEIRAIAAPDDSMDITAALLKQGIQVMTAVQYRLDQLVTSFGSAMEALVRQLHSDFSTSVSA